MDLDTPPVPFNSPWIVLQEFIGINNQSLRVFRNHFKPVYMKNYNVIEERGCNIEYVVFSGSSYECSEFVANVLDYQDGERELPLHERSFHNGNGEPFTYRIELDENLVIVWEEDEDGN